MKKSNKILILAIGGILLGVLIITFAFRVSDTSDESMLHDFNLRVTEIVGNKLLTQKSIETHDFNTISVHGKFDVTLKQQLPETILITTDKNLFPYLNIKTVNNELTLSPLPNVMLTPSQPHRVVISAGNDVVLS